MILITEATSTVGGQVLKRFSHQGILVHAVTRDARKAEASLLPQVEFFRGDFDEPESMRKACSGVDRAFLATNSTERTERQQVAFTHQTRQSG
jgi:uncharacterized protein YbjT (DUF2867 family)